VVNCLFILFAQAAPTFIIIIIIIIIITIIIITIIIITIIIIIIIIINTRFITRGHMHLSHGVHYIALCLTS
jgi:hypothetical protein